MSDPRNALPLCADRAIRISLSLRIQPKGGFAIIIAMVLMAFILLLVLSLASLTTLEARNAIIAKDANQARMNALYGLQEAIGVVQQTAGPDQRVTARADILSDALPAGNKYWTGVWDNRILSATGDDLPDNMQSYGPNRDASGKLPGIGAAPGSGNAPHWLLSVPEGVNLTPADDIGSQVERTIPIVRETASGANDAVDVPVVPVDETSAYVEPVPRI